jgi:hypothetical protein
MSAAVTAPPEAGTQVLAAAITPTARSTALLPRGDSDSVAKYAVCWNEVAR